MKYILFVIFGVAQISLAADIPSPLNCVIRDEGGSSITLPPLVWERRDADIQFMTSYRNENFYGKTIDLNIILTLARPQFKESDVVTIEVTRDNLEYHGTVHPYVMSVYVVNHNTKLLGLMHTKTSFSLSCESLAVSFDEI